MLTKPSILLTETQYRVVYGKLIGEDYSNKEIPMQQLMVKMNKSMTLEQQMKFKSALQSEVDYQTTWVFDVGRMKFKMKEAIDNTMLFLMIITALLFGMVFFQLVLSIESNLKENMWQIGVLRSMGMRKKDIYSVVLIESMGLILASMLLGTFIGYFVTVTSVQTSVSILEMPIKIGVDWLMIAFVTITCIGVTFLGSSFGVKVANEKKISNILKGN